MQDPEEFRDYDPEEETYDEYQRAIAAFNNIQSMKANHPDHSEESYNAGGFLGCDFPYVPGDPFF